MKLKHISLFLGLMTVVGCNYRFFDLADYSELQGTVSNVSSGSKITEESFNSIYQTVIKPQCLSCHSPGESAELVLLDTYVDLTSADFGDPIVVPGNLEESTFYKVLLPSAGRKMMPPPKSGRPPVENARIEVIRSWIVNGAPEGGPTPNPQPETQPTPEPAPEETPEPAPENPIQEPQPDEDIVQNEN